MDVETKTSSSRSSRLLVGTTLVLSLLLTVTVSTVIYLSMWQYNTATQLMNTTPEYVRHGTLQSKNGEVTEAAEDILFYKDDNVVVYKNKDDDGFFAATDFNKGIFFTKDSVDNKCYLLPVSTTAESSQELETQLSDDEDFLITSDMEEFTVIDGEITDTDFIPQAVRDECRNGYWWLTRPTHPDDDEIKREINISIRININISFCGKKCQARREAEDKEEE